MARRTYRSAVLGQGMGPSIGTPEMASVLTARSAKPATNGMMRTLLTMNRKSSTETERGRTNSEWRVKNRLANAAMQRTQESYHFHMVFLALLLQRDQEEGNAVEGKEHGSRSPHQVGPDPRIENKDRTKDKGEPYHGVLCRDKIL